MEGFQYIVERKKPALICFGTKLKRDTDPIGKGLSPFQRRYCNELNWKVTPQTYSSQNITSGVARISNKIRSKKGVGGLASGTQRWGSNARAFTVSPTRYDPEPFIRRPKPNKVPFNSNTIRKPPVIYSTPGVGTYNTSPKRCRRVQCAYNFGKPRLVPVVDVICSPTPIDKCEKCSIGCQNDYWHKNHLTYLCHFCMVEEKILHELYSDVQLREFKKIRMCSFVHSHEGVKASIKLLTKEKLKKMERLEHHLVMFLKN